ncbi:hypothetical protein [Mongoliitalea daihaiensis]|uniref:hypothetical protein n=1 Tax=Mongoliitalea daihaiensis TaxID=2782006 RepID=UPI001F1DED80|nr:hypothetical protein [Mongoliitalea daihaiensis]UJP65674.1 hypothetical protein IPZ59_03340 [Mongoliitalea daihaiensis]
MENKFLKKYPTYFSWLVSWSLWIWAGAAILYYLFLIGFDFDNLIQTDKLFQSILWMVFMQVFNYFFFYRYQKKHALKQQQEENLENKG